MSSTPSTPDHAAPAQVPRSVSVAEKLTWARAAMSLVAAVVLFTALDSIVDVVMEQPSLASGTSEASVRSTLVGFRVLDVLVSVVVPLVLLRFVRRGAGWARLALTAATAASILLFLVGLGGPSLASVFGVVYLVLAAAIVFFLWKKESGRWFAKRRD
ncbi:MAG: hypothetical protein AVDCRST_MAG32-2127 [uncultured Nocardioides sp.]|uniref:Uncharacterized protein n=1 Tax=uncultured Nocardioides sp. TaxID=198441 RepID=A0A6J4NM84_9ACTN|nr:MAG: hypothetical protein AVDCRST_MAG32-2127 [uncultured Nocardioides sp.]